MRIPERKELQDVFCRVCRDSGFSMSAIRAAQFTAKLLDTDSLLVWMAMPSYDVMKEIAAGSHPATKRI